MSKKLVVVEPNGGRKVFHLLHGQQAGVCVGVRDGALIKVFLPRIYPNDKPKWEEVLFIDPRDQRTLVVFDGLLLPNGLPRGSSIVEPPRYDPSLGKIRAPWGNTYKMRGTDPSVPSYLPVSVVEDGKEWGVPGQPVGRFFVLMKSRTAAFVRFDPDCLAPYYVLARVEKDGPEATVTWISSSRM